jgi:hypothetical protein
MTTEELNNSDITTHANNCISEMMAVHATDDIGDLEKITDREWLELPGVGRFTLTEIRKYIKGNKD